MKVKLQDIIDALEWDVDSAVVDDFYKTANTIADSRGFINTDNAEFQLFLRDFLESHELDYQYDLIKNVLEPYYDHSYDLEDEIPDEEEYQSDIELDMRKTQKFLDSYKDLEERFLGPSDEVIDDSKEKGLYSEELEEDYSRSQNTLIDTGLSDRKAEEVLLSVIGQLSDGIWENSRGMEKYWQYADIIKKGSEIYISVNTENYESGYRGKSEQDIKRYFAQKIKQIVKEEGLEWSRDNTEISAYLDRGSDVTVQDAYRVYDKLLGRVDRIKTEESKKVDSLLEWNLIDNDPITYHAEQDGWYFNIYKLEDAQKAYNLIVDYQDNELQDLDDLFDSLEDAKHRAQEIFNKGIQDNKFDGDYAQFEYEINESKKITENTKYWEKTIGFNPYDVNYEKNKKALDIINKFKKAHKLDSLFDYLASGITEPFTTESSYLAYVADTDISDYEIYNGKLEEGTKQKRIARYREFDNGHILHQWDEMSNEEAEEKAKQASIENPDEVYYVAYDDVMNPRSDISWYRGNQYTIDDIMNKRHLQESINFDGFKNSEELQKYFQELNDLPDEITLDGKDYFQEQYGTLTNGNNYVVYTDKNNNDSYIKVYYTLKQVDDNTQKGIDTVIGVTDLREED